MMLLWKEYSMYKKQTLISDRKYKGDQANAGITIKNPM